MWEHKPWVHTHKCTIHIHGEDPAGTQRAKAGSCLPRPFCMPRKAEHSEPAAGGRGYLSTKEKEHDRDTIKMLSRDF